MGDGVAMFDETPSLVAGTASSRKSSICPMMFSPSGSTFADYIRYLTERGEYRCGADAGGADTPPYRASVAKFAHMSAPGRMDG